MNGIVITENEGNFRTDTRNINIKFIRDLVMEDELFVVYNDHGMDITKSTLVKIAFGRYVRNFSREGLSYQMEDILTAILTEDALFDIIQRGGIEIYMEKFMRGAL